MRMLNFIITNFLLISLISSTVLAGDFSLPAYVTPEMGEPSFWAGESPDELLATFEEIDALSNLYINTPDTMMTNLTEVPTVFNGKSFIENMWGQLYSEASGMIFSELYDEKDEVLTGKELSEILANIDNGKNTDAQKIVYGICTHRTSLKGFPTDRLMASTKGDYEDDYNQSALILVNEPVLIKATSLDGEFYYCITTTYSGWAHSSDIAICADREEWLDAWSFPADETVVVTGSKITLDDSGFNPEVSGLQLSMGTILHQVPQAEIGTNINGRFPFFNYVVYLPIRNEDGTYEKTMGLIAKHQEVSQGYLPLTTSNLLTVAFSALGDVYGWGGMLSSMDCSTFVRCIYRCFGMFLALNTTWQMSMPGYKIDLSETDDAYKKQVLSVLKPGAILFFNGHEMFYLGENNGRFYCISAVGNMLDASARGQTNIRTITLNTLDVTRSSGHTWMEDIDTVVIPYLPEDAVLEEVDAAILMAEAAAQAQALEPEESSEPAPEGTEPLPAQDGAQVPETAQDDLGEAMTGLEEDLSVEDIDQLLLETSPEGDLGAQGDPQMDVDVEEQDAQNTQADENTQTDENIVVLDYLGDEFNEESSEEVQDPSQASTQEVAQQQENSLSQELFSKELENPEAAAIRSEMNITTSFHDADFIHGEKGAEYQKYIVLHDTCSYDNGEAIVQYWLGNGKMIAAHFIVDKDGSVIQTAPLDTILHHAGWGNEGKEEKYDISLDGRDDLKGVTPRPGYPCYAMNSYSIGIEMQHMDPDGGDEDEYTEAQLDAVDSVIAYIDAYYGFESEIITHKDWRESNSDTAASFDEYLSNYQDHRTHKALEAGEKEEAEQTTLKETPDEETTLKETADEQTTLKEEVTEETTLTETEAETTTREPETEETTSKKES